MSEHYTRNVEEDSRWCNTCGRRTQHRVSGGRISHCLEHQTPIKAKAEVGTQKSEQKSLFKETP